MVMLFSSQSFVGESENVENTIMPLEEQLNWGPGDHAMVAQANTPLENDLVIVRGLDPTNYADKYPDWEERMLNSYVLCEYFSALDPELSIGWFSRLKLMPIKAYRYKETRGWRKNGFPKEMPEWILKYHDAYTEQLAQHAPETVPRPVHCPNCDSTNIELVAVRKLEYKARAGFLNIEGREIYVPVTDVDESSTHVARLHCKDCDSKADLTDDEWLLPGISN
jgi:hypothetical protein